MKGRNKQEPRRVNQGDRLPDHERESSEIAPGKDFDSGLESGFESAGEVDTGVELVDNAPGRESERDLDVDSDSDETAAAPGRKSPIDKNRE